MYRRLVRDASLYSVSAVLARGFSLITVPIYTKILAPADYGALDLLNYFAVLAPILVSAALDQAVGRFYSDADGKLEKKVNTFFRLRSPSVIRELRERFPDLPETPDPKAVFLKLREVRNDW